MIDRNVRPNAVTEGGDVSGAGDSVEPDIGSVPFPGSLV